MPHFSVIPMPTASKILVTGANGQIGTVLVQTLRERHGKENVIALDLREPAEPAKSSGPWIAQDATERAAMEKIVKDGHFTTVYHLVGLLSGASEKNPELAWKINLEELRFLAVKNKNCELEVANVEEPAACCSTDRYLNTY